jgi:hypothetical protein
MSALVLDAEALSALATRRSGPRLAVVKAHLEAALVDRHDVVVPASVLAELYRGGGHDQGIDACLNRHHLIRVAAIGQATAKETGHTLAAASRGSTDHVDATVVAVAHRAGQSLILTGDPDDLTALAAPYPHVSIEPLP